MEELGPPGSQGSHHHDPILAGKGHAGVCDLEKSVQGGMRMAGHWAGPGVEQLRQRAVCRGSRGLRCGD